MRKPITDIPLGRFPDLAKELGLKPYVADQIISWLYRKRVASFDEMTNLSKDARASLKECFDIDAFSLAGVQEAKDGARKFLCRMRDGAVVECVLIPAEDRVTACISTQVGCAMGCTFCRTAR